MYSFFKSKIGEKNIMKTVKFSVTEEEYTFLKNEIGFDYLETILRPAIEQEMVSKKYGSRKQY